MKHMLTGIFLLLAGIWCLVAYETFYYLGPFTDTDSVPIISILLALTAVAVFLYGLAKK